MSRTLHPSLDLGMVDIGPLVTTPFSGYTYISNFNPGSDNAWCVSDIVYRQIKGKYCYSCYYKLYIVPYSSLHISGCLLGYFY
jgi:hypothetical protein